jgi:hypothetical protein
MPISIERNDVTCQITGMECRIIKDKERSTFMHPVWQCCMQQFLPGDKGPNDAVIVYLRGVEIVSCVRVPGIALS